jgi:hypothetical protein
MPLRKITVNPNPTTILLKVSVYEPELAELDMIVDAMTAVGVSGANRSKVVRLALQRLMTVPVTELAEQLKQMVPPRKSTRR